jgi:glycerol-3-phosphate O-acyltransferase
MEEFMELTLTDPALNDFMAHMAEVENQKIDKIKKKAQGYFLEIASDYNAFLTHLADKTLTWVWQNILKASPRMRPAWNASAAPLPMAP